MVSPPEPTWRKARPDPIYADVRVFAESPPQDLSPTWWTDRLPTWKRRALEAEWRRLTYEPEPLPALDPEPVAEPAPTFAAVDEEPGEGGDAAASTNGLEPADPRPALADPSEQAAQTAEAAPQTISLSAALPQTWPN
jgi:hypothetical protein